MGRKFGHLDYDDCQQDRRRKRDQLGAEARDALHDNPLAAFPSDHMPEGFPEAARDVDELWLDSIVDLVKEVDGDAGRAQKYILDAMCGRGVDTVDRCDIKEALRLAHQATFMERKKKQAEEKRAEKRADKKRARQAKHDEELQEGEDEGEIKDGGGNNDLDPEPTAATDTDNLPSTTTPSHSHPPPAYSAPTPLKRRSLFPERETIYANDQAPSPSPNPKDTVSTSVTTRGRSDFQIMTGMDSQDSPSYVPTSPAYDQYHRPAGPYSPMSPAAKDPVAPGEEDRRKKQRTKY